MGEAEGVISQLLQQRERPWKSLPWLKGACQGRTLQYALSRPGVAASRSLEFQAFLSKQLFHFEKLMFGNFRSPSGLNKGCAPGPVEGNRNRCDPGLVLRSPDQLWSRPLQTYP